MNKLKVLIVIMCLSVGIACDSSTAQKEASKEVEITREISASEKFLTAVSEVHKRQDFLKEDYVSFQFQFILENEQMEGRVTARTNLSEFLVDTKEQGSFYFTMLDGKYTAEKRNATATKLVSFIVSNYHLFYFITGENYNYAERKELEFLDRPYYSVALENQEATKIFPSSLEVFVEQRTNMLKGVSLPHPQKRNAKVFLQYDKFITVNRIPVSLQWNIFLIEGEDRTGNPIGEAKITAIKYLKESELDLAPPQQTL
jgi:hypothetical protein